MHACLLARRCVHDPFVDVPFCQMSAPLSPLLPPCPLSDYWPPIICQLPSGAIHDVIMNPAPSLSPSFTLFLSFTSPNPFLQSQDNCSTLKHVRSSPEMCLLHGTSAAWWQGFASCQTNGLHHQRRCVRVLTLC